MNRLSLAGRELASFHVCALVNSKEEQYRALGPFFREGVEQSEKSIHIVDPDTADEHMERLGSFGVDVEQCVARGQLDVVPWSRAYLDEQGRFDKDRMLALVRELTEEGVQAGYSRVRIVGDMGWAFRDEVDAERLIEYEAEVNDVLARNRQPAICVYDLAKLSGAMVMDLLRTHPLILAGGVVQENPFFTAPQSMLRELREREAAAAAPPAA